MKNKLFRAAASALLTLLLVVTLLPVQAHAAGATLTGTRRPTGGRHRHTDAVCAQQGLWSDR